MSLKIFIILTILFTFTFSQNNLDNQIDDSDNEKHISLIIHESLINSFFENMGEIKGDGKNPIIAYTWYLLQHRIEIEQDKASFHAKVRAKTKC